jgi:hypothetical protein
MHSHPASPPVAVTHRTGSIPARAILRLPQIRISPRAPAARCDRQATERRRARERAISPEWGSAAGSGDLRWSGGVSGTSLDNADDSRCARSDGDDHCDRRCEPRCGRAVPVADGARVADAIAGVLRAPEGRATIPVVYTVDCSAFPDYHLWIPTVTDSPFLDFREFTCSRDSAPSTGSTHLGREFLGGAEHARQPSSLGDILQVEARSRLHDHERRGPPRWGAAPFQSVRAECHGVARS